jgi:hypothetical protein
MTDGSTICPTAGGRGVDIDGAKQDVIGAWVLVGPPDFVPPSTATVRCTTRSWTSSYVKWTFQRTTGFFAGPLAHIAAMNEDWKRNQTIKDFRPSFRRDIAPILLRSPGWSGCINTRLVPGHAIMEQLVL